MRFDGLDGLPERLGHITQMAGDYKLAQKFRRSDTPC